MPAPLLATKLFLPPPRPGTVTRPHLLERLNAGLTRTGGVTLISAPAGFGKTTLVSEWISTLAPHPGEEGPGVRVAWLSLDEGDDDPAGFLTYLIAALQTISANVGAGGLALLQSPQPPPIEAVLIPLINEIASFPVNFVLVLDDYHVIDSLPVSQALTFFIDHQPPQMHLVIATREDPPLPLARLRARGQLTELRAADLRFSPAEAAAFLNQVMGLDLTDANVKALDERTEGWIAGLQLAALSMQGSHDTTGFIRSFTGSHHFILDYLLEEVLRQQPESIQSFLLRTSILSRLCGPLCDAAMGEPSTSGQEILKFLERANLFIVPLDNERRWYRYHHLFGDILQQRSRQGLSPAVIREDHSRASLWYERNGDEAEAFQHAVAAGDLGRAAELAEASWQGMEESFRTAAWLGRVKKLPEDEIRTRPVLCTQMAQAFMDAGEPQASETCLLAAERCLNGSVDGMVVQDEAQLKPLPAIIAMTRAFNAQVQGDLDATVRYAELALQLIPENDLFRRAQATITLEVTHWTRGDLESVRSALVDWMNSMQQAGNFAFVVASAFGLSDILIAQGRLREAIQANQQAIQLAEKHGEDARRITAHHQLGLAMLYHEVGEDAAAAEHLQNAKELGEQTTLVDWSYRWNISLARLKQTEGDLEGGLASLDEAGHAYVKTPIPDTRPIQALKAKAYLKQGRLGLAQDWARARGLTPEDEIDYLGEFEHLVLARVLMAEYQVRQNKETLRQAIALLERLLKAAEAHNRMGSVLEILVVQALAHQAQGNLPLARESLGRALTLAEPEGYLRLFVDEGELMRLMIVDFRLSIEKQLSDPYPGLNDYTQKLLSAFPRSNTISRPPINNPPSSIFNLVEPLSERELEVLRLLRSDLNGPEIAGQLVISPNTFRTHTKNIFAKLGVNNRRAAVRRAEELNLL